MFDNYSANPLLKRIALLGVALYALSPLVATAHSDHGPSQADRHVANRLHQGASHIVDGRPPSCPASSHLCGCIGFGCTRTSKAVAASNTATGVSAPRLAERIGFLLVDAVRPLLAPPPSSPPRAPPFPS